MLVGSLSPSLAPGLAHADATQDVQVVNVVSDGEVCGLSTLDYTSTIGPAKLALEVSKSVSTEVSTSVEVDAQVVSAGVGFNVTEAVTVVNKTEIDVPAGQFAEIYAFPMFENLSFEIVGSSTGKGYLLKPIGVCFAPQRE
ncbi:MAG: DUF6426 family protein [Actinomycetes bacterium]